MDESRDPVNPIDEINEINPINPSMSRRTYWPRFPFEELYLFQERCSPRLKKRLKPSLSSEAAEMRLNPSFKDSVFVAKESRK